MGSVFGVAVELAAGKLVGLAAHLDAEFAQLLVVLAFAGVDRLDVPRARLRRRPTPGRSPVPGAAAEPRKGRSSAAAGRAVHIVRAAEPPVAAVDRQHAARAKRHAAAGRLSMMPSESESMTRLAPCLAVVARGVLGPVSRARRAGDDGGRRATRRPSSATAIRPQALGPRHGLLDRVRVRRPAVASGRRRSTSPRQPALVERNADTVARPRLAQACRCAASVAAGRLGRHAAKILAPVRPAHSRRRSRRGSAYRWPGSAGLRRRESVATGITGSAARCDTAA